jgi:hypothetical protein
MSGVLHGVVASLKAAAAAATDAFFEYVTLLLNTTSTNGAQNNTFLDSSTNNFTVTRNGDTTQGSFNPYMPSGYWSGYFDGTGDWLSVPDNAAFEFGSGDLTVEAWVYLTGYSPASFAVIVSKNENLTTLGFYFLVGGTTSSWTSVTWQQYYSGTSSEQTTGSFTFNLNTWYHVAATKSSGSVRLFVNGTQVNTTATFTQTQSDSAAAVTIGGQNYADNNYPLTGYISNARLVKGTAVYTTNFTPPTTPLTAITNTSLLCLQDNRFKDNSTNAFAITVNGDTRISKFAPFNPPASYSTASYGGSGYFDGNGDELNAGSNAAFSFGTGAYTVECWVFLTAAVSATHQPVFVSNNAAGGFGFYNPNAVGLLQINPGGSGPVLAANVNLSPNIWNHIVAVRSGTGANQTAIFVNGSRVANGTDATNWTVTGPLKVGGITTADYYLNGYMSNLRVVKGTAVYDPTLTTLTVPTTPLTAITNTSLLLNFTNAGIFDAATINDGQTVGNAQVSTTQAKWSPTSMAFDGTGDYLTTIDKPELRIGTADFTIEGWVYLNATGVAYGLVSKGTASTGWSVNVTSGNKLQFSYTATQLTGATSLVSGTWYYFAVVRSGTASGNLRVILNGSTDATSAGAVNDNFNQTNVLYVGADRVAGAVLNGYLQDVRITNGYARTTSTPTAAFPTL